MLEDLKELAWAVLLLDTILLLIGALLSTYAGWFGMVIGIFFASVTTLTMLILAGGNLLLIALLRRRRPGWVRRAPRQSE